MQVKLFKKNVEYFTQDGEQKKTTNFFVECGDVLVPVEVKFFEDKQTGKDKQYATRRTLMSAFAEELPDKKKLGNNQQEPLVNDPTA